jgi:two-component system nitrogen regulation sensor histidine kinase GlnL
MRIIPTRAASAALFNPQDAFDQMPNSILIVDKNTKAILYANTAAEVFLKLSRKSFVGFEISDLFGEDGAFFRCLDVFEKTGITQRVDVLLGTGILRQDQKDCLAYLILAPMEGVDSFIVEWFEIDQRNKSAREERLIMQARANKDLMRNLAHEIKNPLGGIKGAAQLLDYELPDPSLKEYTKVMIKEVDRLQLLVDRLLAPQKKQKQVGEVNIHEVLRE